MSEKILIISGKKEELDRLWFGLVEHGYKIAFSPDLAGGIEMAHSYAPDLILLDANLSETNGTSTCEKLRARSGLSRMPILMLADSPDDNLAVKAFESGADDLLFSPINQKVLTARIKALFRRSKSIVKQAPNTKTEVNGLQIDPQRRSVSYDGNTIELTASQFQILHLLARQPGWVFSRKKIIEKIRGKSHHATERAIDVQIAAIRKKLGSGGKLIETVRGVGYKLHEAR